MSALRSICVFPFLAVVACAAAQAETRADGARLVTDPAELRGMGMSEGEEVWKLPQQPVSKAERGKAEFGTSEPTHTPIDPKSFRGRESGFEYQQGDNGGIYCDSTSNENFADAQIDLPHGSMLDSVRFWVDDESPDENLRLIIFQICHPDFLGNETVTTVIGDDIMTVDGGEFAQSLDTDNHRVDHTSCFYRARVRFDDSLGSCSADSDLELQKIRLRWFRDTGPAPETATFGDVPTSSIFFSGVENLAAAGITAGCGGGDFCPDASVTRAQMAVFLSRALGLYWDENIPDPANP